MAFKDIVVQQTVRVHYDEKMFSDHFMTDFRRYMYDFHDVDEHLKHLAQVYARGLHSNSSFVEGYGSLKEVGIRMEEIGQSEEVLED
jgi:methenyltetrahydromethanopterin cyclohydrolase